jgi:hypothetical protein
MDGKKLVKIFVDFENASLIEDEMIQLVWHPHPRHHHPLTTALAGMDNIFSWFSSQSRRDIPCINIITIELIDWVCQYKKEGGSVSDPAEERQWVSLAWAAQEK